MGTSSAFGGQKGDSPLIPSWLNPDDDGGEEGTPSSKEPIPEPEDKNRFTAPRNNFSRYARSGGQDRRSLGRAISQYVSSSTKGARSAAQHMGSSRKAGAQLLGFLGDSIARGARAALNSLNLGSLAGRPIEEVFAGLIDSICPDGGTIDEGIAREAFIETIVDLADVGVTDLDTLTIDQMQTVFELYASNAIEARICNDIGLKTITLPRDAQQALLVQDQLNEFIRRGVSDALEGERMDLNSLAIDRVAEVVDRIYEQAFNILRDLGEAEAKGS